MEKRIFVSILADSNYIKPTSAEIDSFIGDIGKTGEPGALAKAAERVEALEKALVFLENEAGDRLSPIEAEISALEARLAKAEAEKGRILFSLAERKNMVLLSLTRVRGKFNLRLRDAQAGENKAMSTSPEVVFKQLKSSSAEYVSAAALLATGMIDITAAIDYVRGVRNGTLDATSLASYIRSSLKS